MSFLEHTDLVNKFKKDRMDEIQLYKILYFCSVFAQYEFIEKGKFLFRKGDYGYKFYIIISGSVTILKQKELTTKVNADDYFKILINYYNNGEKDLLERTIKENKEIYNVNQRDIHRLEEISFKFKFRKIIFVKPSIIELENLFFEYKIKAKDFEIDFDELNNVVGINRSNEEESLINHLARNKKISSFNTNNDNSNYRYLENINEIKTVKIYEYEPFLTLNDGKYFGDFALETTNSVRYLKFNY